MRRGCGRRDGVHFETEWVYAQQPLIPHAECASGSAANTASYCVQPDDVDESTRQSGALPLDELCCPFDHGITIPASVVLTVNREHLIYYEGRQGYHEKRYSPKYPMGIGLATWREHRLAGSLGQLNCLC